MAHIMSDNYKDSLDKLLKGVGEMAEAQGHHLKTVGNHTKEVFVGLCDNYTERMVNIVNKHADCMPKRDLRIKELIGNLIGETAAHTSVSIQLLDVNGIPSQGEEMLSETIEGYVEDHRTLMHQLWTDINT